VVVTATRAKSPVRRPSDDTYWDERPAESTTSETFEDAVSEAFADRFDADPDIGA
jgi:hypothetical protein